MLTIVKKKAQNETKWFFTASSTPEVISGLVGGRLGQRSINRRCHGTIAFGL